MPQPYNAAKCVEPAMIRKSRTSLESLLASASGIVARHVISKDGSNPFFLPALRMRVPRFQIAT